MEEKDWGEGCDCYKIISYWQWSKLLNNCLQFELNLMKKIILSIGKGEEGVYYATFCYNPDSLFLILDEIYNSQLLNIMLSIIIRKKNISVKTQILINI